MDNYVQMVAHLQDSRTQVAHVFVPVAFLEAIVKPQLPKHVLLRTMELMTFLVKMADNPKEPSETANASVSMDTMVTTVKTHRPKLVYLGQMGNLA